MTRRATVLAAGALFALCGCRHVAANGPVDLGAPADDGGSGGNDGSDGGDGGSDADLAGVPLDLAAAAPPSAKSPPAHGALFGAFVGVGGNDTPYFLA